MGLELLIVVIFALYLFQTGRNRQFEKALAEVQKNQDWYHLLLDAMPQCLEKTWSTQPSRLATGPLFPGRSSCGVCLEASMREEIARVKTQLKEQEKTLFFLAHLVAGSVRKLRSEMMGKLAAEGRNQTELFDFLRVINDRVTALEIHLERDRLSPLTLQKSLLLEQN